MSSQVNRQTSAEKRAEKRKKAHLKHVEYFRQTPEYKIAAKENALERQTSYERKRREWEAEPLEVRSAKKAEKMALKLKREESDERRKSAELRRQASEERRNAAELRRQASEERKSAEREAAEIQRQIEKGELVVGTPHYYTPVVQGNVSFNKTAAEMEEMIAKNKKRYSKTAKQYPGLFGVTSKASGKRHKKTKKSHKKRKTHKKRTSAHKNSRKH